MTSTPVSLNDESLNDSWIDINSASQIHSPMDDESPEFMRPPHSLAESVQNLGLISFQVERFLQEAQRNQGGSGGSATTNPNAPQISGSSQGLLNPTAMDDNSGVYSSDTDVSVDGFDFRALITKRLQQQVKEGACNNESEANLLRKKGLLGGGQSEANQRMSKSRDCLVDQLSDSLSMLSRASAMGGEKSAASLQDFDWLWDWTAQPEYFAGQEWKNSGSLASKQDYLMRQRQLYCSDLNKSHHDGTLFSGEVISLLFLTNILSIIIGAGLTYSMLMRRSSF